jgi:hypothetical protein
LYIAGGTVTINNSTIADNQAVGGSGKVSGFGYGGGIYNAAGPNALQMHDTILADNTEDVAGDLDGGITSKGYNLIGYSTGGSGFAASDLLNVDPQLGPLQNNGGPTRTMALPADSPAVNAGDPSDNTNLNTPAYDQRGLGFPRIFDGRIDIGAFEVQNLSGLAVSGFPAIITAGATTGNSVTVTARNPDGTTDTDYTGTIVLSSTDPTATFANAATGTPLSGDSYTFQPGDHGTHTFTAVLTKAGTQSITATETTNAVFTGSEGNILVEAAAASTMSVSGFPSPIDATLPGNLTVTLKDHYGNIASGYTGTAKFSTTDPQAVIIDPVTGNIVALQGFTYTFTANDAGVHIFSVTMETPGTQSITAIDTATPILTGTDGGITVNPALASHFLVSAPTSVQAGVLFTFTVTAADNSGHTVPGYTGTVSFSSSDYQAILPADYMFTAADGGVHTFTATLKSVGAQLITVTDTKTRSIAGSDSGITVTPAAAGKLVFGQQPSSTLAGQLISPAVTVDVTDQYGNVITGDSSTVTLTLSNGTFAGGSATVTATASGGVATFGSLKIDTAGRYTLTATDGSLTSASSASFTIQPAAASKFVLAAPVSVTVGQSLSLTVTVEDTYGNVVVGYTGTIRFNGTDNTATLPVNYTFTASDQGVHTFTGLVLRKQGHQKITVTDTHNSSITNSVIVDVLSSKKSGSSKINEWEILWGQSISSPEQAGSWLDWWFALLPDQNAEQGLHHEQPR